MKIKQLKALLLTGTCLLACLACSKDDDPKVDTTTDAKLAIAIKAAGVKLTIRMIRMNCRVRLI